MRADIKFGIRRSVLKSEEGLALVVVIMVMALLLSIIAAGLISSGINLKITGSYKVGTQAFYAADTGVQVGVAQLTLNPAVATLPFSGTLDGGLAFRSGHRGDSGPQALLFQGTRNATPGFSLGSGTGYNPSGYAFYLYQINVTGTVTTPASTQAGAREVEVQAQYGPVPR